MPTAQTNDGTKHSEAAWVSSRFVRSRTRRVIATLLLGAVLLGAGVERNAAQTSLAAVLKTAKQSRGKVGYAVWYNVPINSLARRRAGKGEYTAAHNHLRLGGMVRVTHLGNGKSVIVRITDRGIHDKRVMIDLCKEAAIALGMLSEGMARVRIEELPDDERAEVETAPDSKARSAHP